MCLNAIYNSNAPKYKTQAQIFQNQRAEGKKLDYASLEQVFKNMDFSFDKTPASHHRANMSSHTSVDTPSNKINRGPRNDKRDNRNTQTFRNPMCFACGNTNHEIKDCPDNTKRIHG